MEETNKFFKLILGASFLLILVITVGYSILDSGKAVIEVTPSLKDLGDVDKEGFNYTFTVRNTGNRPLEISKVSTSCGCTLARIDQNTLKPGENTGLHVTFNPKLMKEEVKGKVSRLIFIKSNDPDNPELEIKITANVVS
jgi:hypothetical protein